VRAELCAPQAGAADLGARLLERVLQPDLQHCSNCGGELKVIAAIMQAPVIGAPQEFGLGGPVPSDSFDAPSLGN
jgi:hypothetical protein